MSKFNDQMERALEINARKPIQLVPMTHEDILVLGHEPAEPTTDAQPPLMADAEMLFIAEEGMEMYWELTPATIATDSNGITVYLHPYAGEDKVWNIPMDADTLSADERYEYARAVVMGLCTPLPFYTFWQLWQLEGLTFGELLGMVRHG